LVYAIIKPDSRRASLVPTLALITCGAFVLFLLRGDRKRSPGASKALWLPTIWLVYFSSKPFSDWLARSGRSEDSGVLLEQILLIFLIASTIRVLSRKEFSFSRFMKNNGPLTVLIVLMLVSAAWSDIPFSSLKRWSREILAIMMGFLIALEDDPREAIPCILRRTVYLLVPLSFVLIKWFPQYGSDYHSYTGMKMWIGVCSHKNSLGQLVSFAAFFIIWSAFRKKGAGVKRRKISLHVADAMIVIIALWILKGPGWYSASALIMLVAGLSTYFALSWTMKRHVMISPQLLSAVMAVIMIYGTLVVFAGMLPSNRITSIVGRRSNLTDRTDIWAGLVPMVMKKPVLGYGFGGTWKSLTWGDKKVSPHNGYLEIALGLGFTGLLLTGVFVLSSCRKAHRELIRDFDQGALWICCLLMLLLDNIVESTLFSFTSILTALVVWLTLSSTAKTEAMDTRQGPDIMI